MTKKEKKSWIYILQELCDVLAAALGPRPGIGVIVESGGHDVVLVLHSRLPAHRAVIMRHVEPGYRRGGKTW